MRKTNTEKQTYYLNKLKVKFNYPEINKKYRIIEFRHENQEKLYSKAILDAEELKKHFLAVFYGGEDYFYVLMENNSAFTKYDLKKILKPISEANEFICNIKKADELESVDKDNNYVLMNLLACAMKYNRYSKNGTQKTDKNIQYVNLSGHKYIYNIENKDAFKKNENGITTKIVTLDIRITKDMLLVFPIKTFTLFNEVLASYGDNKGKRNKLLQKVKYTYDNTKGIIRQPNNEITDKTLIYAALNGEKNNINLMDFPHGSNIEKSKTGMLFQFFKSYQKLYADFVKITLTSEECNHKRFNDLPLQFRNSYAKFLEKKHINIIDFIQNEETTKAIGALEYFLKAKKEKYDGKDFLQYINLENINFHAEKITDNAYNIIIVENADWTKIHKKDANDHYEFNTNAIVQHIMASTLIKAMKLITPIKEAPYFTFNPKNPRTKTSLLSFFIKSIVECVIKEDILNKKITIADWKALGFTGPVTVGTQYVYDWNDEGFYINKRSDRTKGFFYMTINPDGTFSFDEEKRLLLSNPLYEVLSEEKYKSADYAIMFPDGSVNIVMPSNLAPIPSLPELYDFYTDDSAEKKIRRKENYLRYLAGLIDINYFNFEGRQYYSVGTKSNGIQGLTRGAICREVIPYGNSKVYMKEIISMLMNSFVRLNDFTAMCFPIKYLREYAAARIRFQKELER